MCYAMFKTPKFICTKCRIAQAARTPGDHGPHRCGRCGGDMKAISPLIRVPKRRKTRAWEKFKDDKFIDSISGCGCGQAGGR